ncbi:MAG: signal transduction histidine kinase [Bacteriovoracaceae bacterium]|jgi:signal transduction histidine kinase
MKKGLALVLENLVTFTPEDYEEKRRLLIPALGFAITFFIPYYLFILIPNYGLDSPIFQGDFFAGGFVVVGFLISWLLSRFIKSDFVLGLPAIGCLCSSIYFMLHPTFAEFRPYLWVYAQVLGLIFGIILTGIRFYSVYVLVTLFLPVLLLPSIDHLALPELLERSCIIYMMALITTHMVYKRGVNNYKQRREKKESDLLKFSSELGTWKWNLINNEVYFDTRYKEILGFKDHEMQNSLEAWRERVEPRDLEKAENAFKDYLEAQIPHYEVKFRMKHKDGHWVPIIAKGKIVERDASGAPTLFAGTHFDFSILEELHKNLENEKLKLVQASKMATLGEMAAGVAHEINNPLAIISNANNLLIRDPEKEGRIQETTEMVQASVDRIAKIVKGLKKYCRIESEMQKEMKNIKEIVLESLEISSLNSKGTKVRLIKEKLFDQEVLCDELEIEQVLINLLNNALYGSLKTKDPWIEVSMKNQGSMLEVMVKDSGTGISEEIVENLFNPFFTTKPINEGTGLGLSIAKGIAMDHKGSLTYQLNDGHTAFVLNLPIT